MKKARFSSVSEAMNHKQSIGNFRKRGSIEENTGQMSRKKYQRCLYGQHFSVKKSFGRGIMCR